MLDDNKRTERFQKLYRDFLKFTSDENLSPETLAESLANIYVDYVSPADFMDHDDPRILGVAFYDLDTKERRTLKRMVERYEEKLSYTKGVALTHIVQELGVLRRVSFLSEKGPQTTEHKS